MWDYVVEASTSFFMMCVDGVLAIASLMLLLLVSVGSLVVFTTVMEWICGR